MNYKEESKRQAKELVKELDLYPTLTQKERLQLKCDIEVFTSYDIFQINEYLSYKDFRAGWYRAEGHIEESKEYTEDWEILISFIAYRFDKDIRQLLNDYANDKEEK